MGVGVTVAVAVAVVAIPALGAAPTPAAPAPAAAAAAAAPPPAAAPSPNSDSEAEIDAGDLTGAEDTASDSDEQASNDQYSVEQIQQRRVEPHSGMFEYYVKWWVQYPLPVHVLVLVALFCPLFLGLASAIQRTAGCGAPPSRAQRCSTPSTQTLMPVIC